MISNILYVFKFDKKGIKKAFFWEWLHGILLAFPSIVLLIVIWELFEQNPNTNKIWNLIILMVILLFIQFFIANKAMISSNLATYEMSRRLRLELGNKLQRLSLGYYKSRDPGELAGVVLQDVAVFENIFGHSVTNLANAIFGMTILGLFLLYLDWRLALTLLVALAIILPLIDWGKRIIVKQGTKQLDARKKTDTLFLEYIQGIQHIKSYGLTGKKFRSLNQSLADLCQKSIKLEAFIGPIVSMAGAVLEVFFILMVWMALYFLTNGTINVPVLIAFLIIGYRLYEPVKILLLEYPLLNYMNISLSRIREVLEAEEQTKGQQLEPNTYDIEFKDVHFKYIADKNVLDGISFIAPAGQLTALVGSSGSGKTTITSLIARFWDVQKGKVKIGGIDIKDMAPSEVYNLISEVFQEVYLFDGSIYENIKIGNPNADDDKIMEAARLAQVLEFSNELPDKLATLVGEGGAKLSGGQKQRISIARALLKDAPIILLDEATSSLDPENEVFMQRAIHSLVKDKTVVVIAHKLSTIKNADNIIVLKQGKIVERGKHNDLLRKENGIYSNLWNIQQKAVGWNLTKKNDDKYPLDRTQKKIKRQ